MEDTEIGDKRDVSLSTRSIDISDFVTESKEDDQRLMKYNKSDKVTVIQQKKTEDRFTSQTLSRFSP